MNKKKLKSYFISFFLIISLLTLGVFTTSHSEENTMDMLDEDSVILADEDFDTIPQRLNLTDVLIRNLSIENLSNSSIEGNFNIVNTSNNYISNLWYTTEVYVDLDEDTNLINSFSTPFEIMRNQEKTVSFSHNLPSQLPKGNYSIIVKISNRAGNSSGFAFEDLGELGVDSVPFLTFDVNNSYIYNNEQALSISTTSTFLPNEDPSLKLQFTNIGTSSVSGYTDIKVYKRNELFDSEPVATKQIPNVNFSALQTKDIALTLPSLDKPESYVAVIRIKDNNDNPISSTIKVSYIIGGEIVNIVDSSIKKDGDLYKIDYFISGKSDGSILPEGTLLVKIFDNDTNELIYEEELFFSTDFSTEKVEFDFSLSEDITNIKVIAEIYSYETLLDELETNYDLGANLKLPPTHGGIYFEDVEGTIYKEAIYELANLGIINGYPDGTFRPNNTINRAEIATLITYMLNRQYEVDEYSSTQVFNDVEKTHWANGFINIIKDSDLIVGYPDGTFRPNNNITFAETLTILVIAINGGTRLENAPEWPENYLQAASEMTLTSEFDFESGDYANRGEVAMLVYRALQLM